MRRWVVLGVLLTIPLYFLAAQQGQAPAPPASGANARADAKVQQSPEQQKAPKPGQDKPAEGTPIFTGGVGKDFSQEAFVIEKVVTRMRVESDGTGSKETVARIRVQSEAGVEQWGQVVIGYSSANEKVEIPYVRVRKADGSVVTAPADSVQDLTAPVAREAPVYTDYRQKHITVPGLRPGEVLEYDMATVIHTPLAPKQFWSEYDFDHVNIVLDEELEVDIPKDRKITLKNKPGYQPTISEENGRQIYRWKSSHLERALPAINLAPVLFADGRLVSGLVLQRDLAVFGDIDFQFLIEHDVHVVEVVLRPELLGRERRVDHRRHVVLQHFPRTQSRHGDVLLTVVGVHGSLARHRSGQVLHRIRRSRHHAAVRLPHAHVRNLDLLVRRAVADHHLSPLLHPGLALHPNACYGLLTARPVAFEPHARHDFLNDKGFLREVLPDPAREDRRALGRFVLSRFGSLLLLGGLLDLGVRTGIGTRSRGSRRLPLLCG